MLVFNTFLYLCFFDLSFFFFFSLSPYILFALNFAFSHTISKSFTSSSSLSDEQLVETANGQAKMRINLYEHKGLPKKLVTGEHFF